jgi:hypothetical protein
MVLDSWDNSVIVGDLMLHREAVLRGIEEAETEEERRMEQERAIRLFGFL